MLDFSGFLFQKRVSQLRMKNIKNLSITIEEKEIRNKRLIYNNKFQHFNILKLRL